MYNVISDKCVGNLLSARKHNLVAFEGEMLYQVSRSSLRILKKFCFLLGFRLIKDWNCSETALKLLWFGS